MPMVKARTMVLALTVLLLFGCGAKRIERSDSAETLYKRAMDELQKKRGFPWIFTGTDYDTVLKLLKEIQLRYTFSPYATLAELRTADTYFKKGEFEQASIEYEDFIKRHPSHEETPYATFRLGLSHFKQMRSYDRDPTNTREAIKWFDFFLKQYPDSTLRSEAEKMLGECRDRLARREIYIGNFYENRKNHKAAVERYKVVVDQYANTRENEEALFLLGISYSKMGQDELAKDALKRVMEEYPKAKYHKKAAELLSKIEEKEKREAKKG
jgi:outer membrane protein assembly factor BamD